MINRMHSWAEAYRDQIGNALANGAMIVRLFVMMFTRTLGAAGAIFAYLFYTATPETTVYQLTQFVHQDGFWIAAFMFATFYSMVLVAMLWVPPQAPSARGSRKG